MRACSCTCSLLDAFVGNLLIMLRRAVCKSPAAGARAGLSAFGRRIDASHVLGFCAEFRIAQLLTTCLPANLHELNLEIIQSSHIWAVIVAKKHRL